MIPPTQRSDQRPILQGAVLVLLVLLAYFPALRGQFLWDDDVNVTDNLPLRSWRGLAQIWFEPGATQQYYPLTHTSFWLDYHLWGLHPLPYHLENILLHAFSAVLVWRILKRLNATGAWLGAALFALHPVCVESVAWITQRKNAFAGIFFFGATLMCVRFWLPDRAQVLTRSKTNSQTRKGPVSDVGPWKFYWLALVLYLCALWSKTAVVGLPIVVGLLLWWKRGRIGWWNMRLLVPFFVAGMAVSLITIYVEKKLSATGMDYAHSIVERCLIADRAAWFYLGKLVWPHPLVFMYPLWDIRASQPMAYLPIIVAISGMSLLWRKRNGWGRPALAAIGCFLVLLFPVAGFFQQSYFAYSLVADHFQYFACVGPLALAGAGLAVVAGSLKKRGLMALPAIFLLLLLGGLTWRQTAIYQDLETLWRDVVIHNPKGWGGHYNLGLALVGHEKLDEGVEQFTEALQDNAHYAPIRDNLGNALMREGKLDEAIQQYGEALQISPDYANAHNNLGNALLRKGNLDGAIQQYTKALETNPDFADAHYNLGNALARKGSLDEAVLHYIKALQIRPDYSGAHNKLGNIYAGNGRLEEAIQRSWLALKTNPENVYTRYNLGNLLAAQGNLDAAIDQYSETLRFKPDFAEAHASLGDALAAKGRLNEATESYRNALQINPNQPELRYRFGIALAKQGKLAEARLQFTEALRLKPDFSEAERQLQALPPAGNKEGVGPGN